MTCYHPLQGYRSKELTESGKYHIVFNPRDGYVDLPMTVPCGQCVGCRLSRSKQWAVRCMHEASLYDQNCFITLTYNDDNLPKDKSLKLSHFQNFMKRLRKSAGSGLRFYHCGEYGPKYGRPHYHAILFNFDFSDRDYLFSPQGEKIYRSAELERLWPYGFSSVGNVTYQSAAYVARYIMKKVVGKGAEAYYEGRKPEYTTMSRRPGIGKAWFTEFYKDVFPDDFVIVDGRKQSVPRYYDSLYEHTYFSDFESVKFKRRERNKSPQVIWNNSPDRLAVRKEVLQAKLARLKRYVE